MKESLVAVALRLQVAVKVSQTDEQTTVELRKDCTTARKNALIANKRADAAAEIIQALKIEVSSLKRKLKEVELQQDVLPEPGNNSQHQNNMADVEVCGVCNSSMVHLIIIILLFVCNMYTG